MTDIFVSYSRKDERLVKRVIEALESCGYSLWWDQRLTPHESWDSTIEKEIKIAKVVLVLWSPRAVSSEWVRSEADYAKDEKKLISARLQKCELPLAHRLRQTADLARWNGDVSASEWIRLVSWINYLAHPELDASNPAAVADANGIEPTDPSNLGESKTSQIQSISNIQGRENSSSLNQLSKDDDGNTVSTNLFRSPWCSIPIDTTAWIAILALIAPRNSTIYSHPIFPVAPIVNTINAISIRLVGQGSEPVLSYSEFRLVGLIIFLYFFFLSDTAPGDIYPLLVDMFLIIALGLVGAVLIAVAFQAPYFNWIGMPLLFAVLLSIIFRPRKKGESPRLIVSIVSLVLAVVLLSWSLMLSQSLA